MKDRHIDELRSESYSGSDDEWRNILRHSLRLEHSTQDPDSHLKALEVVASLSGDAPKLRLTVTVRRRVSGISQKLGAIALKQDEELDLNAIDWACEAVEEADTLRSNLVPLERNYQEAQATIKSLEKRLDELLAAKAAHEDALTSKFAQLLNEKKVKIRNQQRLLSTAKVDPKRLKDVKDSTKEAPRRSAPSRRGKRRASRQMAASGSSDEFETMRAKPSIADKTRGRRQSTESNRETTQSETETETDAETGEEENVRVREDTSTEHRPALQEDRMEINASRSPSPPPTRELPFTRKGEGNAKAATPSKAGGPDDEETASESDDEL